MHEKSDSELLLKYSARNSEQAFVELVRRHIGLVHSVSLRVVRDRQLAEDVTQEVFVQLAHQAKNLAGHSALPAWLHRTTRNISSQHVRTAVRRRRREQQHATIHEQASTAPPSIGEEMAPCIDSLIDELSERDRTALIYRYFQRKSAREMAAILGTSAEAAQKRVSRAVEQLRAKYARRGVNLTADELGSLIAVNAVNAAPVGMATTISAVGVAASNIVRTNLISTAKTIIMTSFQKTLATSAIVVFAGATLYQTHQVHQLERKIAAYEAERKHAQWREIKNSRQPSSGDQHAPPHFRTTTREKTPKDPTKSAFSAWLDRVDQLKTRLEQTKGAKIPEMQWLTENDWIEAAKNDLSSDDDYRRAFSALRGAAEKKFSSMVYPALQQYMEENGGAFPKRMDELCPFFQSPVEAEVLDRWQIIPSSESPVMLGGEWTITQKSTVDAELDAWIGVGTNGHGSSSPPNPAAEALMRLTKQFTEANGGKSPQNMKELLPYATTPEQKEALSTILNQAQSTTAPHTPQP